MIERRDELLDVVVRLFCRDSLIHDAGGELATNSRRVPSSRDRCGCRALVHGGACSDQQTPGGGRCRCQHQPQMQQADGRCVSQRMIGQFAWRRVRRPLLMALDLLCPQPRARTRSRTNRHHGDGWCSGALQMAEFGSSMAKGLDGRQRWPRGKITLRPAPLGPTTRAVRRVLTLHDLSRVSLYDISQPLPVVSEENHQHAYSVARSIDICFSTPGGCIQLFGTLWTACHARNPK